MQGIKECLIMVFGFVFLVSVLVWTYSFGSQPVPVENSKTGIYKALAQLTLQSFENGDRETAATLAQILEQTWEQVEQDGERGLKRTNPELFQAIGQAMRAFTAPLIDYKKRRPQSTTVESAYSAYLEKLKAAD